MSWITLPNDPVTDVRGRVIQTAQLDDNLEVVFRPLRCPGADCDKKFTNLQAFQDHVFDHDEDLTGASAPAREARVDLDVAHLIFQVLGVLRAAAADSPLAKIRKANDSMHAERTWARAWVAREDDAAVQLNLKQYEWLQQLLARRLPLSKEDKADNVEAQTFAQYIFGLSWFTQTQALTIVSDRKANEAEQPPAPPVEVHKSRALGPTELASAEKSA